MKLLEEAIPLPESAGLNVADMLAERHANYGEIDELATMQEGIMEYFVGRVQWGAISPGMRMCIQMIIHKMCRILNGNPRYSDSYQDIEGYARLLCSNYLKWRDNAPLHNKMDE